MPLRWSRFPDRFTIIFIALTLLLLVLEHVNGRFWLNDFRVYHGAANALRHGEDLYGVAHGLGSGYFKYAPVMAMLYIPLTFLPYAVAASIQYAFIVAAFIGSVLIADRLVRTHLFAGRTGAYTPLFLGALVVIVHLHRELHLGNINVLLMYLLLFALDRLLSGKRSLAGILIGVAILAKPHFVVLLPLLFMRGYVRTISTAIATASAGLLLPAVFLGPSAAWTLHSEWLVEMAKHNASLIYTGGDTYNNVDTVYSFLHRALLKYIVAAPSRVEVMVILGCIAAATGAIVLWNKKRERTSGGRDGHILFEYFLLMALVPSITLTDTNHFLFATPLVLLIMRHLLPKAEPKWLAVVAVPALLAYGGNWADALGPLSDRMVHFGVLGMANTALLVIGIFLLLRDRSNLSTASPSTDQPISHA